jgi:hypothetical protein
MNKVSMSASAAETEFSSCQNFINVDAILHACVMDDAIVEPMGVHTDIFSLAPDAAIAWLG